MEYFDVLTDLGGKTGETKLRSEVHSHGDWHRSIHIWIINSKGELLMQKRAATKDSYPNMWNMACSGHIKEGRNSLETATEELKEEMGIEVAPSDLQLLFTIKNQAVLKEGTFIDNEFNDVYLLKKEVDMSMLKLDPAEVSEAEWMDYSLVKTKLSEGDPNYIAHTPGYDDKLFAALEKQEN